MRLAIGCDEAGLELKNILVDFLHTQNSQEISLVDYGVNSLDPR